MSEARGVREHMEVVGSDGSHVGTVDRVQATHMKLTRNDNPDGDTSRHRYLPLTLLQSVSGNQVTLRVQGADARNHVTWDAPDASDAPAGPSLGDTARDLKETARDLKETAVGVAKDAREAGSEILDATRNRAAGLAEEGKGIGAERVLGFAQAIRAAADDLEQSSPEIARHVRSAAESVQGISSAVRERSMGQLLGDVTDFARRQPIAFFGLTAAAGFALARFAKSSAATTQAPQYKPMAAPPSGAPGWIETSGNGRTPATLAAASLGGAAAHRPGQAAAGTMATIPQQSRDGGTISAERSGTPL